MKTPKELLSGEKIRSPLVCYFNSKTRKVRPRGLMDLLVGTEFNKGAGTKSLTS